MLLRVLGAGQFTLISTCHGSKAKRDEQAREPGEVLLKIEELHAL
jgi:hypothetical protein